jgi:hypothetical protein
VALGGLDALTQFFKLVVKHYYIAGRPLTRDKAVKTYFLYPNTYIASSYSTRMMRRASASDAQTQFFKPVVKHYYIAGRQFTKDKVV